MPTTMRNTRLPFSKTDVTVLVSVSRNETLADTVEGRWTYQVTAAKEALLRLDGKSTIRLQFTGPLEALGRMDNDVRVYKLHLTPRSS